MRTFNLEIKWISFINIIVTQVSNKLEKAFKYNILYLLIRSRSTEWTASESVFLEILEFSLKIWTVRSKAGGGGRPVISSVIREVIRTKQVSDYFKSSFLYKKKRLFLMKKHFNIQQIEKFKNEFWSLKLRNSMKKVGTVHFRFND